MVTEIITTNKEHLIKPSEASMQSQIQKVIGEAADWRHLVLENSPIPARIETHLTLAQKLAKDGRDRCNYTNFAPTTLRRST